MTTIIGTGEVGALHSREELEEMQRLPLQRKIQITTARIIEWYQHYDGKVYVAFSGGKDSTVLLDIVRRIYPDVPAVFSDTGLEFPEVREFVKSCENVTIVRPEMNFRKVIEVYGYPVVSKRVANTVEYGHKPGSFRWKELHGEIMRSNGTPSEFNCKKWCYLLDAPFKVSSRCCTIMKKQPMKKYSKETGRVPIIATMANESRSRRATWLRMGCNAFSGKKPSSQPMSFWTEEDVLEYLYTYQVPYASVYGEIVRTDGGGGRRQAKSVLAVSIESGLVWEKDITIVGRGHAVKELAKYLDFNNATVTVAHSKTKSLLQATQNRDVVIYATPIITQDISYNTRDLVIDLGNSVPHPDRLNCPYVNRIGRLTVSILLNRFAKKESVWI